MPPLVLATRQPQAPVSFGAMWVGMPASGRTVGPPSSVGEDGTQVPARQRSPSPHTTPLHGSGTHTPSRQSCSAGQVTPSHALKQTPSRQTSLPVQRTLAQRSGTHSPPVHHCPTGQVTPAHASTHAPAVHVSLAAQVALSQPGSTQSPAVGVPVRASHARPVGQSGAASSVQLHDGPQSVVAPGVPARQTWFVGQTTPRHGSRHAPPLHTRPAGHTAPSQGATHAPARQSVPAAHATLRQAASTQVLSLAHAKPDAQPPSKHAV